MSPSTPSSLRAIDWAEVMASALPYFLRKPLLQALLRAAYAPLRSLQERSIEEQERQRYRLEHSGQVFSLLSILEERFPSDLALHYRIEDLRPSGTVVYALTEASTTASAPVATAEPHTVLVTGSEQHEAESAGFAVYVPQDRYQTSLSEIQYLIECYRLPTKHPIYLPINR